RLPVRLLASCRARNALGDERAPRLLRRRDVSAHGARGRQLLPQADELSVPPAHLPEPNSLVPRAAATALRVRHRVPLRTIGRAARSHAHPGFTQDDSHIFCTPEQLVPELTSLLDFVLRMLRVFGFEEFEAEISTRPEAKSVGSDEDWDMATRALFEAIEASGLPYEVAEGQGAFYGPKIDIHVKDAIGRRWQLSTLQVDFQMARRFGLHYAGPDHTPHSPIMIHRALFGSVERFFGILIEHFAGSFPAWLAPLRARVLPRRDHRHLSAAAAC